MPVERGSLPSGRDWPETLATVVGMAVRTRTRTAARRLMFEAREFRWTMTVLRRTAAEDRLGVTCPGLEGVQSILEPGVSRTVTLRFDAPGYHVFRRDLLRHAAAGMTGAVLVQEVT